MYKVTYFIKIKSLIFGVILFGGARPIRLFADHIHRVDNAPSDCGGHSTGSKPEAWRNGWVALERGIGLHHAGLLPKYRVFGEQMAQKVYPVLKSVRHWPTFSREGI